jgi:hypothetical protein
MVGKDQLLSFLAQPEKYVLGDDLPPILPKRVSQEQVKACFPQALELSGYCPVTLKEVKEG